MIQSIRYFNDLLAFIHGVNQDNSIGDVSLKNYILEYAQIKIQYLRFWYK
jgi:hypothetical protein